MKVELDTDETWELMSLVVARLADEATLSAPDKATLRRWRSAEMKPGSDRMRALTAKINEDIAQAMARKQRSAIRKPDWR